MKKEQNNSKNSVLETTKIETTSNPLDLVIQETEKKPKPLSEIEELTKKGFKVLKEEEYIISVNQAYFKYVEENPIVITNKDGRENIFSEVHIIGSSEFVCTSNIQRDSCGLNALQRSVRLSIKPPSRIAVI